MAWTQNSDIELKGVQFQAFFIISGQIKGWVEWCMVTREPWRPKVGGGAGACPMASIIRAFPAILPLLWLYLYPHNICPFLFRTDSNCVQSQRAWSDGGFVPSSSQVRVPVFVALPTAPLVPPSTLRCALLPSPALCLPEWIWEPRHSTLHHPLFYRFTRAAVPWNCLSEHFCVALQIPISLYCSI